MKKKTKTMNRDPSSWHPEFIKAQRELERIIFSMGPRAVFLPQHAELVRTAARYAPLEHARTFAQMTCTVDFVEACEAAKQVIEAYGQEALTWPQHAHLVERMMQTAHPDLVETFRQEAQACGLLPPPAAGCPISLLH
ncbi:hypothetical protein [Comamonas sp. NoAH]|uniref:hypothetical protein n=1 Tax=Comamonas halotolerans TaxID=3041496 RepID=UPI0024E0F1D5|nr:hypothetical protein [Comamonas sp. NoAH]